MRRLLDLLFRGLVRSALGLFFRRVEIVGTDRLPARGATIYVGNHGNSLIDPALAIGWLPTGVRLLGKSTLWEQPSTSFFVRLAGAIPVYRRMDEGVDASRNAQMFSRCWELLGERGSLALFPEGISHNEPNLQPLKTGAARIALGTLSRHPGTELAIVPFGLTFDDRDRFRSRALIEIGHPIDPRRYATNGGEKDPQAVRALTDRIEDELVDVTLNYSSWEEAALIRRSADLYVRHQRDLRPGTPLAERLPYQRAFAEGYSDMEKNYPQETTEVRQNAETYFRALDLLQLTDSQVTAEYPPGLVARFLLRSMLAVLILLPLGVVGALIHWLPYHVIKWAVGSMPLEPELRATYKLMAALLFYPATWILVAWIGIRVAGPVGAVFALVLAPLTGYLALRLTERIRSLVVEARAYLVLKRRGPLTASLRALRERLLASLERLIERYLAADQA